MTPAELVQVIDRALASRGGRDLIPALRTCRAHLIEKSGSRATLLDQAVREACRSTAFHREMDADDVYETVMNRRRHPRVVAIRHDVMYRMTKRGYSYAEVGEALGMDWTTVLNGVRRHRERVQRGAIQSTAARGRPKRKEIR